MAEYIFGANILENLTTGMYKNSQVIFREYIQNPIFRSLLKIYFPKPIYQQFKD